MFPMINVHVCDLYVPIDMMASNSPIGIFEMIYHYIFIEINYDGTLPKCVFEKDPYNLKTLKP